MTNMDDQNQYHENDERVDFDDFELVHRRWVKRKQIKDPSQMRMFQAIANTWCIGKSVLDAGCGMGIGTRLMGQEALGILGIDRNPDNIEAARAFFESPTVKFETMDLLALPERPITTFDVVACLEVIEHVKDYDTVINNLKKFYEPKRRTIFLISSPNRNSDKLGKDRPKNEHHVREWTAGEFYQVMTKHFHSVVMYSAARLRDFSINETVDGNTQESPLIAKCEDPIL